MPSAQTILVVLNNLGLPAVAGEVRAPVSARAARAPVPLSLRARPSACAPRAALLKKTKEKKKKRRRRKEDEASRATKHDARAASEKGGAGPCSPWVQVAPN